MDNSKFVRKFSMECPICNKIHEIEERKRITEIIIKNVKVNYEETYYLCTNSSIDVNEFVTGRMMDNNLLNARNEYERKVKEK